MLPSSNFSASSSSVANDFTTLIPSNVSSTCELISPIWLRCFLNALRIRVLKNFTKQNISGSDANTITVSGTFTPQRIINETIIFSAAMKNSSGQWCANSVISNKSLVIRAIICPTLCSAKYECESVSRCANKSRRISVSIFAPIICPVSAI